MSEFTFDHMHLRSTDPEGVAAWYERMLGAQIIRTQQAGATRIDLRIGGANVFVAPIERGAGVNAAPESPHAGLDHFGLTVKGIDAVVDALKAKGVAFTTEPTNIRPGVRIAFLRGPDGVSIELLERT